MRINTKFSLNDKVFTIHKSGSTQFIKCEVCEGKGGITTEKGRFNCESCYGNGGKREYIPEKWKIGYKNTTIGKVYIEMYNERFYEDYPDYRDKEFKYMIEATGIGSGTVWYEKDLFKTEKEAQKECDRRNKLEKI